MLARKVQGLWRSIFFVVQFICQFFSAKVFWERLENCDKNYCCLTFCPPKQNWKEVNQQNGTHQTRPWWRCAYLWWRHFKSHCDKNVTNVIVINRNVTSVSKVWQWTARRWIASSSALSPSKISIRLCGNFPITSSASKGNPFSGNSFLCKIAVCFQGLFILRNLWIRRPL